MRRIRFFKNSTGYYPVASRTSASLRYSYIDNLSITVNHRLSAAAQFCLNKYFTQSIVVKCGAYIATPKCKDIHVLSRFYCAYEN